MTQKIPECPSCGSGKFDVLLEDNEEHRILANQAINVVLVKKKKLNGLYRCQLCGTEFNNKGEKNEKSANTSRRKRRKT